MRRVARARSGWAVAACVAGALAWTAAVTACGADEVGRPVVIAGTTSTEGVPAAVDEDAPPPEDFEATAADFTNIHDMTAVRGFFVDNRLGHLDEALAIAEANEGGTYPVGTILQLVPQEAMVKRAPGFSPAPNDWEFFMLDVTPEGTTIVGRGGDEVVNRFGGSCATCHQQAEARFDLVCEDDHGCEPLPIDDAAIVAVQEADPRPQGG